jgi:type I restriction enzyme M protein
MADAFEEAHTSLVADAPSGADAEDPVEYRAKFVFFWVPPEARWAHLRAQGRQRTVDLTAFHFP